MKKDISLTTIIYPVGVFLKRFNFIIFFLLVSASLFFAILTLLPITSLSTTETQANSSQAIDATFDQTVIDKLQNNSSPNSYTPQSRNSPFTE